MVTKLEVPTNAELPKMASADTPLDHAIVISADKLAHGLVAEL